MDGNVVYAESKEYNKLSFVLSLSKHKYCMFDKWEQRSLKQDVVTDCVDVIVLQFLLYN